jgi:penicillin-binding protein 1A
MMRTLARVGLGLLILAVVAAALVGWSLRGLLTDLPDVASLRDYDPPVLSRVYSRDGVLMAELFDQRREVVAADSVPPHVVHAFLAAEDSSFYRHNGLDFPGILRAAWANLREGRVVQGGSTITQQVAKSLLLTPERSLRRKVREAVLALRIERNLSKAEILHLYLNQIYLGHSAYGVEAASQVYFGIPSAELSVQQAALLAGLPQAPSRYDPFQHPERARERRRYVLQRMAGEGWLAPEEVSQLAAEPLDLVPSENPFYTVSPYFSEQVRQLVEERRGREAMLKGGLRVTTTMDSRLQAAARTALRRGLEAVDRRAGWRGPLETIDPAVPGPFAAGAAPTPGARTRALVVAVDGDGARVLAGGLEVALPRENLAWALPRGAEPPQLLHPGDVVLCEFAAAADGDLVAHLTQEPEVEGALVCLDPHSGEVLACVGGYDFARSQFNRAVQAQRQPGSAIKPLVYAAALENGYTPATLVYDTPIVYDSPDLDEKWKPRNYSKRFYGATTLREALVHSRNIITVKVLRDIGVPRTVAFLKQLGVSSPLSADLSLALGASSLSLLELVKVYGVFASGGELHPPRFVLQIEDPSADAAAEPAPPAGQTVLSPATAFVMVDMMQAVIREGTGRRARGLKHPAAGKTGTTNDNRDAWFLGFTPSLVTGVWVGYDDGRTLGKRETGGIAAAPIWLQFMQAATRDRPPLSFPLPEGVEFARIDAATGHLAGARSEKTFTAAFLRGTVPQALEPEELSPATSRRLDPNDPSALDALR